MSSEPKIDLSEGLFENLDKLTMSKRMFKKKLVKKQEAMKYMNFSVLFSERQAKVDTHEPLSIHKS